MPPGKPGGPVKGRILRPTKRIERVGLFFTSKPDQGSREIKDRYHPSVKGLWLAVMCSRGSWSGFEVGAEIKKEVSDVHVSPAPGRATTASLRGFDARRALQFTVYSAPAAGSRPERSEGGTLASGKHPGFKSLERGSIYRAEVGKWHHGFYWYGHGQRWPFNL